MSIASTQAQQVIFADRGIVQTKFARAQRSSDAKFEADSYQSYDNATA